MDYNDFSTAEYMLDNFDLLNESEEPSITLGVKGSLASERRSRPARNFNKDLKILRSLEKQSRFYLSMEPENFNIKLSDVATSYPHLPGVGDMKLRGLHKLEGKGQARKWIQLLIYLADWEDQYFFIHHTILERITSRLFNSHKELEGSWLELRDLVSVYGKREVRLAYLNSRYSLAIHNSMKSQGAKLAKTLFFSFVDTKVIKPTQRKSGYDDHGHLKLQHENHGIPGKENTEMISKERVDVQEKLFEIFTKATENYLVWLENQTSNAQSGNHSTNMKKEVIANEQYCRTNENSTTKDGGRNSREKDTSSSSSKGE